MRLLALLVALALLSGCIAVSLPPKFNGRAIRDWQIGPDGIRIEHYPAPAEEEEEER